MLDGIFVCGYKNIGPGILLGYLCVIQTAIIINLGIKELLFLKFPSVASVLDNRVREIQSPGNCMDTHKALTVEYIQTVFRYLNAPNSKRQSHRGRLVLGMGFVSWLRRSELHLLTLDNVLGVTSKVRECIIFRSTIGSVEGNSKTERRGFNEY